MKNIAVILSGCRVYDLQDDSEIRQGFPTLLALANIMPSTNCMVQQ